MDSTTSLCAVRCLLGSSSESDNEQHCTIHEVPVRSWTAAFGASRGACVLEADFTEFVEATERQLYYRALRLCRHAAQAEDLTQQAYLKLWVNWTAYRSYPPERKKALAFSTVKSVFIDYVRVKSNKYMPSDLADHDVVGESDFVEELIASENAREVLQAMEQLPEIWRKLIESVYFDGSTVAAFAENEGLAPKTASRYHNKALQMLHGILGER
ncbi:sigma-70 family RNA polymerase sigma factor [Streptomyces sp. MB09-01]|uniref:RNA polymerase sigma factor n=1 Tax=Streptomyces sp. MB09-01 TaxID=3028666 RepID=UPI0029B1BAD7|nr:sigma-70 family RNA polymerase sigma factor [Streptomyces sp. MB09-01]MDX3538960.1 sigma-70 family RNA polymerase sigma factor [Streptomyces sp. MB09-01]